MKKVLLLACCALLAFAAGCGKNGAEGGAKSGLTIAVIPKGTTHEYWKSIKAGAEKAGQDLGVNIIWHGPLKENDRAQQISIVEQFISQGVSGIVLAPLDDVALQRPVQDAKAKKYPLSSSIPPFRELLARISYPSAPPITPREGNLAGNISPSC